MSHARIEEVSDSDPSEGDISDFEDDFDEREIMKARPGRGGQSTFSSSNLAPSNPASKHPPPIASFFQPPSSRPVNPNQRAPTHADDGSGTQFVPGADAQKYKDFSCIYPLYFDASRSRSEGRMVGKELAVENPMAREIVNACARLGLEVLFEPSKIHPRDWANPGRVKVGLKKGARNPMGVKNKHHLYIKISEHLKANPTTPLTATLVRVPGLAPPDLSKPYPEPAVPKGWKMNKILPYFSSGLTGGGVSENFFKDMMQEMGNAGTAGGLPAGMDMNALQGMMGAMGGAGGPSGGGEGKKEKKVKKKVIRG